MERGAIEMRLGFLFLLSLSGLYLADVCIVLFLSTHGIKVSVADLPVSFPALTAVYLWSCAELLVAARLLRWISRSPRLKAKPGLRG